MNRTSGYYLLNKKEDYLEGLLEHMECSGNGICCRAKAGEKGIFLSGCMDSLEQETEWHRLTINGGEEIKDSFQVSVYAAEWNPWQDTPGNQAVSMEVKLQKLKEYRQLTAAGASDLLLHGVKGRYLWILLEVYGREDAEAEFHDITVYFPAVSWITFLPEVYQRADYGSRFLERYLSIFQTLYEDLNRRIDMAAELFDVVLADVPMLKQLMEWLDIGERHIWPEGQLNPFLNKAVHLFKIRGTRKGIEEMVELYTGEAPFLVECWQLSRGAAVYRSRLYPEEEGALCILVREGVFRGERTQEGLEQVVTMTSPVQAACHLVVLSPYIFLGSYTYLGVNSGLEGYKAAVLSRESVLSQAAIGCV